MNEIERQILVELAPTGRPRTADELRTACGTQDPGAFIAAVLELERRDEIACSRDGDGGPGSTAEIHAMVILAAGKSAAAGGG